MLLPCFMPELHDEAAGGAAAQRMQQPDLRRSQRAARAPRKHALAQHQSNDSGVMLMRPGRQQGLEFLGPVPARWGST